jgi:hypothetical protein
MKGLVPPQWVRAAWAMVPRSSERKGEPALAQEQ